MIDYTSQIQILHFSDLHFGENHICAPSPSGSKAGIPSLGDLITTDLASNFGATVIDKTDYSEQKESPLVIAVSGDFTQRANHEEFEDGLKFLSQLTSSKILSRYVARDNVFIIPGNHDVRFTQSSQDERFQPYASFYNKFYKGIRSVQVPDEPIGFTQVHGRVIDGNKLLVAEINCCMYVEKDTVDSSRGQVDFDSLKKLRVELSKFKNQHPDFDDYIKVAIMHHHVVLLPSFIESGRGVDSIMNAGFLLELLCEYEFQLILHGHKHYPHIFTYEPVPLWSQLSNRIPQVVIAGGSCGSKELPTDVSEKACNTYSVISIKWHPKAKQARINVITRGLRRKTYKQLTPDQWFWETVNISDKVIAPYKTIPTPGNFELASLENDERRLRQYEQQRYCMAVAEVMPSLIPGQAYEVRAWIVKHRPELNTDPDLIKVEWTAGKKFKRVICSSDNNSNFVFSYHYWGPMLLQAKLIFADGYETETFVYARMPKDES
jgi:DNA repair exonuclease SbcCD nuclease subunit